MWRILQTDIARLGGNLPQPIKWGWINDQGRIIGRVIAKDGEFSASKMEFDPEGVGKSVHKGMYATLDQAKAAVEAI